MLANGLAFAVRVSGQQNSVGRLGCGLQFLDDLFLAFDLFVYRLKVVVRIHAQLALRQILDVTQRRFDDVILAQILIDRRRLCRRFHDNE